MKKNKSKQKKNNLEIQKIKEVSIINKIIIEKDNLLNNIKVIKERAQNSRIIAVLKGNAYGVGNNILPGILIEQGINTFAVTEVQEAVQLRNLGIYNEILVLNSTCVKEEVFQIVLNDFIATIGSYESLDALIKECSMQNKTIKAHIKIDTGFSRFGFDANKLLTDEGLADFVAKMQSQDCVEISGAYTHFQESYSNDPKRTIEQFNLFTKVTQRLKDNGFDLMCHCSNSCALFKYPQMNLDAVRVGSAFSGKLQIKENTGLKRVGYLETQICEIRNLKKGARIGYSGTATLKQDTKVGICEVGYADGMFVNGPKDECRLIDKLRNIKHALCALIEDKNRYVYLNNKKVKILGRIGMKNFVIDLSNVDGHVGDRIKIEINLVLSNQLIPRELY